jgi:hypothetical protein
LKVLCERLQTIRAIYVDVTGVGNAVVEEMQRSGITNVTGVTFTIQKKEDMATILREKMRLREFLIPYEPVRRRQDIDLCAELNIEKYELMKTGHIRFSHPEGSHDDIFWAVALAVYASVQAPMPGTGAFMVPH